MINKGNSSNQNIKTGIVSAGLASILSFSQPIQPANAFVPFQTPVQSTAKPAAPQYDEIFTQKVYDYDITTDLPSGYLAPEIEIANLAVKKAEAEEKIAAQRIKDEENVNLA